MTPVERFDPPQGLRERVLAAALRLVLRLFFKGLMRPPLPVGLQRAVLHLLSLAMPTARGTVVRQALLDGVPVERVRHARAGAPAPGEGPVTLYLHGGAFCTGSPRSHRALTSRLARLTQGEVVVPDYRRAPEHPFPAQIDDSVAAYRGLLAEGHRPARIAVAGDSAGGTLAFLLAAACARAGLPPPGAVVLLSPAMELGAQSQSAQTERHRDPLVNLSWGRQAMQWYAPTPGHPLADPKDVDLRRQPPTLVQVGEHEVLFDDALWVRQAMLSAGRPVHLEVYNARWHVFQIHCGVLPGANVAVARMARFIVQSCGAAPAAAS